MNNLNNNLLPKEIKSQLVKLPYEKRRVYSNLIDQNLGKFATIIVRPFKPVKQTVKLHKDHITQLNAGWIQSITLVDEADLIELEDGNLIMKTDVKMIRK